jgi:hypothetical protein
MHSLLALKQCLYNPVNHRLGESPVGWPYLNFHRFVEAGIYSRDWGTTPVADVPAVGNL